MQCVNQGSRDGARIPKQLYSQHNVCFEQSSFLYFNEFSVCLWYYCVKIRYGTNYSVLLILKYNTTHFNTSFNLCSHWHFVLSFSFSSNLHSTLVILLNGCLTYVYTILYSLMSIMNYRWYLNPWHYAIPVGHGSVLYGYMN